MDAESFIRIDIIVTLPSIPSFVAIRAVYARNWTIEVAPEVMNTCSPLPVITTFVFHVWFGVSPRFAEFSYLTLVPLSCALRPAHHCCPYHRHRQTGRRMM